MSYPLGTTTFGFGNLGVGTTDDDIEGRTPPYDASHECRRDMAADRTEQKRRLRLQGDFYEALAEYRKLVRERNVRIASGKDGVS